jgi:hypothetical protein
MDMPQLTPERQKMLMGAAAAGLLLVLGFSFAPSVELADSADVVETNELLALVEEDRSPQRHPLAGVDLDEPRPFHRPRLSSRSKGSTRLQADAVGSEHSIETESADQKPLRPAPPSYQKRLELLAEEEALLMRQQRSRGELSDKAIEPASAVTAAAGEQAGAEGDVEHALAEARRPGRFRRVELIESTDHSAGRDRKAEPRGAWLSGNIELE